MFDALRNALETGKNIFHVCEDAICLSENADAAAETRRTIAHQLGDVPLYRVEVPLVDAAGGKMVEEAIASLPVPPHREFAVYFQYRDACRHRKPIDCVMMVSLEKTGALRFMFAWFDNRWIMPPIVVRVDPEVPEGFRMAPLPGFSVTVEGESERSFGETVAQAIMWLKSALDEIQRERGQRMDAAGPQRAATRH